MSMLGHVIDAYERPARLYPALLCLFPVAAVVIGVYGNAMTISAGMVTLVGSFGGLYLLMSIARDMGKRVEPKLYEEWGGKPTTQLLRHRDSTINPVTKKNYHEFLEKHINSKFPTAGDEASNPGAADHHYEAGVIWLLDKTRDKVKFPLIFKEGVNYGFRRNCLGMKPIGALIAILALLWTLVAAGALSLQGAALQPLIEANLGTKAALVVSAAFLSVWGLLISPVSVRRVAFAYADMLLRACDKLPKKR